MGMEGRVRLLWRWRGAAGVALVLVLAVVGAYVEANPAHGYGGLHLASHPPLPAYLLLAVPAAALVWRDRRPVEVLGLTVGGQGGRSLGRRSARSTGPRSFRSSSRCTGSR
jgi:hypothetical protein